MHEFNLYSYSGIHYNSNYIHSFQRRIQNPGKHLRDFFAKIINGMKPLTIFTKLFILDVSQGSKYAIYLSFCLVFTIFSTKKQPKKSLQVFEKGVASNKFTFTV